MGTSSSINTSNPNAIMSPSLTPWLTSTTSFDAAPYAPPGNSAYDQVFNEGKFWNGLAPQYQLQNQGTVDNSLDPSALNALQQEGLAAPGTSAWEGIAQAQNQAQTQQQRDAANAVSASQNEAAQSALAASGGISGGARERLGKSAALNNATTNQGINQQSGINALNISSQAEQNRQGILSALPGQQLNAANYTTGLNENNRDYATGVQNTNITNNLNALNQRNANDQNTYQQQMQQWASLQQANATANQGKGHSGGK